MVMVSVKITVLESMLRDSKNHDKPWSWFLMAQLRFELGTSKILFEILIKIILLSFHVVFFVYFIGFMKLLWISSRNSWISCGTG